MLFRLSIHKLVSFFIDFATKEDTDAMVVIIEIENVGERYKFDDINGYFYTALFFDFSLSSLLK